MAVRRCEQHRADEATVHTRTRIKIGPCARGEIDSSLAPAQKNRAELSLTVTTGGPHRRLPSPYSPTSNVAVNTFGARSEWMGEPP